MNMMNIRDKVALAHLPTPLHNLPRLSAMLGIDLWIKRDDNTGLAGGGNKARKLEYLLADAQAHGADMLITAGAIQSNHARQTAAAAAQFGLDCVLLLARSVAGRDDVYHQNGNILLDYLLNAEVLQYPAGVDLNALCLKVVNERRAAGRKPYLIPVGGSTAIGSLGYVEAIGELTRQVSYHRLNPAHLYLASGSAGTHAGVAAGTLMGGHGWRVQGISVAAPEQEQREKVACLVREIGRLAGQTGLLHCADTAIYVDDRQVGSGYGQPTEAMEEAVRLMAGLEGILLDPVYTGKAMAGLIADARCGKIKPGETVVFLHTGGSHGLFAYASSFPVPQ